MAAPPDSATRLRSIEARKILDDAVFPKAPSSPPTPLRAHHHHLRSGGEDQRVGLGTRLVTAYDQPPRAVSSSPPSSRAAAAAVQAQLSEQTANSNPGVLQSAASLSAGEYRRRVYNEPTASPRPSDRGQMDPPRRKTIDRTAPTGPARPPLSRRPPRLTPPTLEESAAALRQLAPSTPSSAS